jgi:hypothetical protein
LDTTGMTGDSSVYSVSTGAILYGVFFFLQFFWLINIGQSYALGVSVCSGVAFQPAHCIVSLKNLTAASISSSVLRETFKLISR